MNSNDANLGLLSNQQNSKYKEPQSDSLDIELQDIGGYDQDYISLEDAKVQHNDIAIPNLQQQPVQMLASKNQQNQQPIPQQQQLPQQNFQQQQQPQQPKPQQYQQTQVYLPQNPYQNTLYNPYNSSQYQDPIDQIYNSVTGIFQQTAVIVNSQINQMGAKYSTCQFCRTAQLISDEKQAYQCYNCKQVNKPLFGYFQCGTCKTTVMYQQGVSNVIKCTKCNTMNYVQQSNLPFTYQNLQQSAAQQSQYQNRQQQPQQNQSNIYQSQQQQPRPPQAPPQQQQPQQPYLQAPQQPYQQSPYSQALPPPPPKQPQINEAQKIQLAKNQVDPMYDNL